MTRKELFFSMLNQEFTQVGFRYLKTAGSFTRKVGGNVHIYSFNVWPYFFQVEANLMILIKDVENVKKQAWGTLYSKFESSVGQTKTYLLSNGEPGVSLTDSEENVFKAVQEEISFYYGFAEDYFNKYSDIAYLDIVLNNEPGKELFIAYNPINTSFLALIVAWLNKNSNLHELIGLYREIVKEDNSEALVEYDLLAKHINGA